MKRGARAAAWRALVVVLLSVYLPRIHAIRVRKRFERLAQAVKA